MMMNTEKAMITFEKSENCIYFFTLRKVSENKKVVRSGCFYIVNEDINSLLAQSKEKGYASLIVNDCSSFTMLNIHNNMLFLNVTWLESNGFEVSGNIENYEIPLERFIQFVESSGNEFRAMKNPTEYKTDLCFKSSNNLKEVLANKLLKRKFIKFMVSNFHYPKYQNTKIIIQDDFVKYSFFFTVYNDGKESYCGGIILHDHGLDIKDMHYEIHT